MIRLPGLIDPHVHVREPGQTHKEDWDTVTQAALAGGVTAILAMPNTKPPIFDSATLDLALDAARRKARCDFAQFVGAGPGNADILPSLAPRSAGMKMYLDSTFGELRLDGGDFLDCVPSICELSTASRRTYIATNRSGFGKLRARPSSRPSARSASDNARNRSASQRNGGSGGNGFGTNAR